MVPQCSTPDVVLLIEQADRAARRLCRKLGLPAADLDDLRQDLLVDLICRLARFDAKRASLDAFASVVLRNRCSRAIVQHHRRLRAQGGHLLSIDVSADDRDEPLVARLAEQDGSIARLGQYGTETERAECRTDLDRALRELSEDAQAICIALTTASVADLVARQGLSRSSLYRHLGLLRLDLAMRGIGARWDGFRSA